MKMSIHWPKYLAIAACLIGLSIIGYRLVPRSHPDASPAVPEIWFDDLSSTVSLDDGEATRLMHQISRALSESSDAISVDIQHQYNEVSPQIVFLSASDTQIAATVTMGSGQALQAALNDALAKLRKQGFHGQTARWLKIDLAKSVTKLPARLSTARPNVMLPLRGIAFQRPTSLALLSTEVAAFGALDDYGQLVVENLPEPLFDRLVPFSRRVMARVFESSRTQIDREIAASAFSVESYFFDDKRVVRLYQGQRMPEMLTPEVLLRAARQAGAYLQRSLSPQGRFDYSYLPGPDRLNDDYNLVRHAGTIYAMLELYQVDEDPELLQSAQRAIDHLLRFVSDYGDGGPAMSLLVSGDKIKLGGVALTIVALAKFTEVTADRRYLPLMNRLARYVQDSQLADGAFISQRYYPSGDIREDFVSQYYPGEAMLALLRLHALDARETWLDTAEKAARYLITVRDQAVATTDLSHDHWLLYALNELYQLRPRPLYLAHAMRIAQAIVLSQNRDPRYPAYLGSYYLPPRSTPTAVRTEGLLAAHELARNADFVRDAEHIRSAIELGIGFQLRTQIQPETAMYFKNPQKALGGFHRSLTDYEVRIDYVQHNLSAILGFYHLLTTGHG